MNIGDRVQTVPGHKPQHSGTVVEINVRAGNDASSDTSHVAIRVSDDLPWLVLPQTSLQPA